MKQTKIMIVEDEAIVAMELGESLVRMGFSVSSIHTSGEDAIESVMNDQPDLVLMDINLKGKLDGVETANVIWLQLKIPVIFISANTKKSGSAKALKTDLFKYLDKPVNHRLLEKTINTLLQADTIQSSAKRGIHS